MIFKVLSLIFAFLIVYNHAQSFCFCQNGGTCLKTAIGVPLCQCPRDYTGVLCEKRTGGNNNGTGKPPFLNCQPNVCLNNGKCMVIGNRLNCICPHGFNGTRCEHRANTTRPSACSYYSQNCKNGAICTDNGTSTRYTCKCAPGFVGTYCTFFLNDPCLKNNYCHNTAKCNSYKKYEYVSRRFVYSASCSCPANRLGTKCEKVLPCSDKPCKNDGKCIVNQYGYYCKCRKGFEGRNCDIPTTNLCEPNPCENEGICYQRMNFTTRLSEVKCICQDKWSGKICTEDYSDPCRNNPCKNNGQCQNFMNGKYSCKCPKGFFGQSCEIENPCKDEICSGNGFCTPKMYKMNEKIVMTAECLCHKYYHGKTCQLTNPCFKNNPCLNGGKCKSRPIHSFSDYGTIIGFEKATCKCKEYFAGENCDQLSPCILNNPCENEGQCNDTYINRRTEHGNETIFGDPNCTCPLDYEGIRCESRIYDPCEERPCENGGTCTKRKENKHKYECLCTAKFEGENCETKKLRYEITSCDFENGCPDFQYYTDNKYHWKTRVGTTPSYMTGPSRAYEGSKYGYTEASSPAYTGNKAYIKSRIIETEGPSCISLYYHMFGAGIGKLRIYLQDMSGKILGNEWSEEGPQGNEWHHMQMEVTANKSSLILEGTRGQSWSGDIAVDNIKWMSGLCISGTEEKP